MTDRRVAERVHVLGVRHHGPGSAESVAAALDELRPDVVLVEGPPELTPILPLLADPQTVPPVAGLVYAADEPRRAAFYPLAAFSPEWVATRWALHEGATVSWIDLPAATSLAMRAAVEEHENQTSRESPAGLDTAAGRDTAARHDTAAGHDTTVTDPIGALAEAAGYDDPERWWEDAVEHRSGTAVDRFTSLREAIDELRRDEPPSSALVDDEKVLDVHAAAASTGAAMTATREAAMRKAVRAAVEQGAQRVAVVCGAWHAPALGLAHGPSAASDNRLLRGLPKTKVAAAWVPWTAGRLSYESGYGAGVTSPGWYRHLYDSRAHGDDPETAAAGWMVRTARELREQGIAASPASVVDATRLARTLATLRGRPHPGLAELDDAALAVLADGDPIPLHLVHENLVVGHDMGAVPDDAPMIPLAADLQRRQRACRLKPSAASKTVTLDLRTDSGRMRSALLHRLRLLGIDWGEPADVGRTTGTFKEAWQLVWDPSLSIAVVEAGMHGTTVASAAAAKVAADARAASSLPALSELVDACLLAELPTRAVVSALADRAATHAEVAELLAAVEPLARVCRYGNVRGVDTDDVRNVVEATAIRAAVGLPASAVALADDAALALRDAIEAAHRGLMLLADPDLSDRWFRALAEVTIRDATPGLVGGRATRMLLDAGRIDRDAVEARMSRTLSTASDPADAAGWLDGFLTGDAMILIHDAALLAVVDEWLTHVAADAFDDLLPLLRRTFAEFGTSERRNIGRTLTRRAVEVTDDRGVDWDRAAPAFATVAGIIGWERA